MRVVEGVRVGRSRRHGVQRAHSGKGRGDLPVGGGGKENVFSFIKTLVYTTRVLINEDIFIDDNNNMTTQTRNT